MSGFWMYEQSGVLQPVVTKYLHYEGLTAEEVLVLRSYFRQWIELGNWRGGSKIDQLRASLDSITTVAQIDEWLDQASELGIDPL